MLKCIKNIFWVISTISLFLVLLYVMGILKVNKFYFPILLCFFATYTIFIILRYLINKKRMELAFGLLFNCFFTIPCSFLVCVTLSKIQIVLIIIMFVVLSTEKILKKRGKWDGTVDGSIATKK